MRTIISITVALAAVVGLSTSAMAQAEPSREETRADIEARMAAAKARTKPGDEMVNAYFFMEDEPVYPAQGDSPDRGEGPYSRLVIRGVYYVAVSSYSPDDVRFMQDMIPHHHQAVQMAELVANRTNRPELADAAGRINLSQRDEIEFMEQWLTDRGEAVPDPSDHAAMHTDHRMAGMATPKQMADLAAATGTDFDRLFLQLMITHHEGAVTMVEELHEQPGAAYDPVLFEFTTDVTNDQTAEIERMHAVLITLSDDPRAGLKAGFDDAGRAILNLALLASVPRPPGFFDPENPASLPPEQPADDASEDVAEDAGNGDETHETHTTDAKLVRLRQQHLPLNAETAFADTVAAFEALPAAERERLEKIRMVRRHGRFPPSSPGYCTASPSAPMRAARH